MATRNLAKVLDAIICEIPHDDYDSLVADLTSLRNSAMYSAPEAIREWWVRTAEALEDGIGDPSGTPWKEKVAAIFADKIDVGA